MINTEENTERWIEGLAILCLLEVPREERTALTFLSSNLALNHYRISRIFVPFIKKKKPVERRDLRTSKIRSLHGIRQLMLLDSLPAIKSYLTPNLSHLHLHDQFLTMCNILAALFSSTFEISLVRFPLILTFNRP